MPAPTSNKAPSFEGDPSELMEFFEYFEDLDEADKCKSIVRYADRTTKQFWKSLPGFATGAYNDLKTEILSQYPGADKGARY